MTSCIPCAEVTITPSGRGKMAGHGAVSLGVCRWPTDSVGAAILTLTNVVVGSRVNIRDQAGTTTLYDGIAMAATVALSLSVYSAGSPLNDWRIKVRNASGSPSYVPYETIMTATAGSFSIYVSQIPDE